MLPIAVQFDEATVVAVPDLAVNIASALLLSGRTATDHDHRHGHHGHAHAQDHNLQAPICT